MSYRHSELQAIIVTTDDLRHLKLLTDSSMTRFPRVAHFLARELDRANLGRCGPNELASQVPR